MLGAAAVMAMAVSSGKAGNTGSETTAETASASVSETVETAPAAETATNAVNLKADGIKVDTAGYKTTASGLMYKEVKAGKADGKDMNIVSRAVGFLVTFNLVCLGWLLFRADSMQTVHVMLYQIFHNFDASLIPQVVAGYKAVFADPGIVSGFLNSVKYTVIGTIFSVVMLYITAYPLSDDKLPGRKWISLFFVITMYFGGGMIPTYLVVKQTGLIGNMWSLFLPGGVGVGNTDYCPQLTSRTASPTR